MKIIRLMVLGLALLMLPATSAFAQTCVTKETVTQKATSAGWTLKTEIEGTALSRFLDAWAQTLRPSDKEFRARLEVVKRTEFWVHALAEGVQMNVDYGEDGCAIGSASVPQSFLDAVYTTLNQMEAEGIEKKDKGA